jgi:hypothetical protein
MKILPLVVLIRLHAKSFSFPFRGDTCDGDHVLLYIDTSVVAQRQRPVISRVLNRTPEVDDLEALGKQLRHLLSGEMAVHARNGRCIGLIDVHLRYRLAVVCAIDLAWLAATNGYTMRRLY